MKVTNKLNLPEPFVLYASQSDHEPKQNRYSVTELLMPIREILLNRKYYNYLEEDVVDCIPALFGTAVHNVLESHTPVLTHLSAEESIEIEIDGITISGRIDLIDYKELEIIDYKTSSVSKVMREDFEDWRLQGLMYAYLVFKKKDIIMKKTKFWDLLKDWSKLKSVNSSNYPSSPVYLYSQKLNDSDFDYIEKWIKLRLHLIKECLETGILPLCTDEEKWYTGTKYAVYKKAGDKRAAIVLDSEQEAHDYITNKCDGVGVIEVRKGEYLKCKYYCACAEYCRKELENVGLYKKSN